MLKAQSFLVFSALLVSSLMDSLAFSYIENRAIYPLGEAEAQMANAGVALRGSSGSAFFNPAGLASLRERKLSLTGNTYMHFKTELTPFMVADGQDLNFSAQAIQIVPSSLVSTWTSGAWTYAFGVYVPELVRTSFVQGFSTPNLEMELARSVDAQLLLVGLSAGGALSDQVDIGYGCYLGQFQATQTQAFFGQPKPGSGLTNAAIANAYYTIDAKGLLCQAGLQRQLTPETRMGLVLRLPFLNLSGQGRFSSFTQDVSGNRQASGIQNKAAKYAIPMDVSFGISNKSLSRFNFLADLSYQFPEEFEAIEGTGSKTKTKGTLRSNFGLEYEWAEKWMIRGGYALNPSAIEIQEDGDSREDYHVWTLGTQFSSGPATTGIGFFYTKSKGENRLAVDRNGSVETTVTAIMLNTGFVF